VLLERASQLRSLDEAARAVAGGDGRCVLVEGAAGTGKSTLLAVAGQAVADAGVTMLRARCNELEREYAWGAVRQLLEPLLRAAGEDRERWLAGAAAPLARMASSPFAEPASVADTAALLHALYWFVVQAAEDGPLMLVVDDAHWCDVSSLRALSYLAGRVADLPVGVVVALRPHEPGGPDELLDQLRAEPGAVRLGLDTLTRAGAASKVRSLHPGTSDEVCEAVHQATGGNPLLVEELLRATRPDSVKAVQTAALPLLAERLARRMEPEGRAAPALAQAMSVLGDGGALEVAAELAGLELAAAGRTAHRLRRIEVLSTEDPFAFVHPLVRRSVYDSLPAIEREAAHRRAAQLLRDRGAPAQTVAAHLDAVPPAASPVAAASLEAAARAALADAATEEAVHWLRRALAEGAPEPPRAELLALLGSVQARMRDPAAVAGLEQALELSDGAGSRARIATVLAHALVVSGRWDRALEVIDAARALDSVEDAAAAELAALGAFVMAYDPATVDHLDRSRGGLERFIVGESWAARALAAVLAAIAAHRGDDPATIRRLIDVALEGDLLLTTRSDATWAGAHLLIALVEIEDYEGALAAAQTMAATARREGSLNSAMVTLDHRAWLHNRSGDLAAAEADLRTARQVAAMSESPTAAASQAFYCMDALLERPQLDDLAEGILRTDLDPGLALTWIGAAFFAARGRLRLARRDRDGAVADLRASFRTHVALHMGPAVSPSRSGLALALPQDAHAEALALVHEELDLARATGLARPVGVALRAAGILEGGGPDLGLLRESVEVLDGSGSRLEHSRSLVALGGGLRRAGLRNEARAALIPGMELAVDCGAQRLAERASGELRAAGGRPRPAEAIGVEALTASERRVASLAAQGATNAEIAQELYVGLKTVETHLSHAYAKLGIAGAGARRRLEEKLTGEG
jgi:DNA-binding CsgD family transcriptional regulator